MRAARAAREGRARPRLEEAKRAYLRRCQALIWPGEENLGIAPLEALASGRPVVAYRAGGALETLAEGVTGRFFDQQTPEALVEALRAFEPAAYEPATLRAHVARFDIGAFQEQLRTFVAGAARDHAAHGHRRRRR